MRLLGFPFRGYVIVSVVLIVVGLTLLLFRKLGHPVLISMGCGAVFTVIGGLLLSKSQGIPIQGMRFLEAVVSGAAFGLFAFYVFDAVLILSEFIRSVMKRRRGG